MSSDYAIHGNAKITKDQLMEAWEKHGYEPDFSGDNADEFGFPVAYNPEYEIKDETQRKMQEFMKRDLGDVMEESKDPRNGRWIWYFFDKESPHYLREMKRWGANDDIPHIEFVKQEFDVSPNYVG